MAKTLLVKAVPGRLVPADRAPGRYIGWETCEADQGHISFPSGIGAKLDLGLNRLIRDVPGADGKMTRQLVPEGDEPRRHFRMCDEPARVPDDLIMRKAIADGDLVLVGTED